jgi:hypothetical protein
MEDGRWKMEIAQSFKINLAFGPRWQRGAAPVLGKLAGR